MDLLLFSRLPPFLDFLLLLLISILILLVRLVSTISLRAKLASPKQLKGGHQTFSKGIPAEIASREQSADEVSGLNGWLYLKTPLVSCLCHGVLF